MKMKLLRLLVSFPIFLLIACTTENTSFEVPELDSIFLGYPIFTGNRDDHSQDQDHLGFIRFDLRHNFRFLEFDHPIFPADEVTDEDIINWATMRLGEIFLPGWESPFWAVINLDNGNQLAIELVGSTYAHEDTFVVAYRRQESDASNQRDIGWFDIAYGIFVLGDTTIDWRGFTKDNEGNYVLRDFNQSPFD